MAPPGRYNPPAVPLYPALRPLLFRLDPETSHGLGIAALRLAQALPGAVASLARRNRPRTMDEAPLRQTLFGREFPNPVGLAAGFDKNAAAAGAIPALGLRFRGVGPRPPPGPGRQPEAAPLPPLGGPEPAERPRLQQRRHGGHA